MTVNKTNMKTLYLVRHAKSSWDNKELKDIDRPLNERGYRDAHSMSAFLLENNYIPELIVTSPAIRAMTTAIIFSRVLNVPPDRVAIKDGIYEASIGKFLSVIEEFSENYNTIMVCGHNSTITQVANNLSADSIENIPTSGSVGIVFNINSWKDIKDSKGKRLFFRYPKSQ